MFAMGTYSIPYDLWIFGVPPLLFATMILVMMVQRNKLVAMIVDSLSDQRKVKDKKPKRDGR